MSVIRTAERSQQRKVQGFKLQSSGSLFPPVAPVFVVASTFTASTIATTHAWPRSFPGDLGVLVIEASGNDATVTPSGWQHFDGSPVIDVADATGSKLMVLWQKATATTAQTFTIPDPGDHHTAQLFVFRGVQSNIAPGQIYATDTKTIASTSAAWPSITTLTSQNLVLFVASIAPDNSSTSNFSSFANANLTNVQEIGDVSQTPGNGGGFGVFIGVSQSAQNIGSSTATSLSTTSAYFVAALEPSFALPT
jgi:hypothetical protein